MTYWGDTEEMEAEEELATLSNPVSLLEPAKSGPEVIDLFSTIPKEPRTLGTHTDIFAIDGLGVVYYQ